MGRLKYLFLVLVGSAAFFSVSPPQARAFDVFSSSCSDKSAATSAVCQQAKNQKATDNPVTTTVRNATSVLAILGGLLAVIMIIVGGFSYITSVGNTEATGKAKKRIINAVVGLAIIGLAWTIIRLITDRVIQ